MNTKNRKLYPSEYLCPQCDGVAWRGQREGDGVIIWQCVKGHHWAMPIPTLEAQP